MNNKLNVAVLGSTGYVGMELVKILSKHKHVKINFLGSDSNTGIRLKSIDGNEEYKYLPLIKKNEEFNSSYSDCVFLALPHSVSNNYVKDLYGRINIIDLSADFRLDSYDLYKKIYNSEHSCPDILNDFIYGLSEINRKKIQESKYIAVPGCYPTSILLPLIPLIRKKIIDTGNIIIDSKSGYSGAGKNFDLSIIKNNFDYNFFNYNTNSHRHISEIKQELEKYSDKLINFSFNPHILPNFRGMMSTIYCDLDQNKIKKDVIEELTEFSEKNPFIKYCKVNDNADFFSVQNTNYCKIKIFDHIQDNKIILVSLIDNLIKGASGQAVQCFNLLNGFDETISLL